MACTTLSFFPIHMIHFPVGIKSTIYDTLKWSHRRVKSYKGKTVLLLRMLSICFLFVESFFYSVCLYTHKYILFDLYFINRRRMIDVMRIFAFTVKVILFRAQHTHTHIHVRTDKLHVVIVVLIQSTNVNQ